MNAFNNVAGRGDYFNQASGTSEGQFLLLLGLLEAYAVTKSQVALAFAKKMLTGLAVLYRSSGLTLEVPANVDATHLFAPHWLFCVKSPFQSATIHYADTFAFTAGVATISDSFAKARYIFQVASVGYTLVYPSPYSPLASGTSYAIASTSYDAGTGTTTITLSDTSVNATLAIIFSVLDGPTIQVNQPYEAWPDWRPLAAGEIDAACDTFNWGYRCFARAFALLGNPLHARAAAATLQQSAIVYDINDSRDWLKPNYQLEPFAQGGSFSFTSMTPAPTFACDASGNVTLTVPSGVASGEAQYGIAAINDTYATGDSTVVILGSTIAQTVGVFIDTTNQEPFDPLNRYTATVTLTGNGLQTFTLTNADFKNSAGTALAVGSTVYTFGFDDDTTAPHTLTMSRVRQLPNLDILYLGGAIPFTANFLGQPATLISWRGPVYMGYQSPWMLKQIGNETNVATAVQMLADAQAAWTAQADTHDVGPFAPVFIFNRSDAVQYGPTNTFGWNGPDPNTGWVGYQFRPLAELAELVFACDGSEAYYAQAVGVVDAYLDWLDGAWTTAVDGPPSAFPQTGPTNTGPEPHAAALALRAVLYMDLAARPNGNQSGVMNATYSSLLNKVYTMLQSLYQTSGTMAGTFSPDVGSQSWFGFWHGEILRTLALLYQWASSPNIAENAIAGQALAWINGMIGFVNTSSINVNLQAQLPVVTDGAGHYYSPIQRNFGGFFWEDITDLDGAIRVYANGTLVTNYTIGGPGLAVPGASFMGLYLAWNSPPSPPVTAEFNFYFRVRLESDRQDFDKFINLLWTAGGPDAASSSGLKLMSARAPNV